MLRYPGTRGAADKERMAGAGGAMEELRYAGAEDIGGARGTTDSKSG